MENKMKVSVIIPVYNVEKYLNKCFQSVLDQSYDNIEIIAVDDGSTDKSSEICDKYEIECKNLKVIHKKNGGLSSARNEGLKIATGDAIFFLDSDDYISKDCIKHLVNILEDNNADISIIQMKYVDEDFNQEVEQRDCKEIISITPEGAIEESLYQRLFTCCAPAKLYKKKVIGDIRFPLGKLSEDLATCHLFINNAQNIVYSSYYGYYYRQHESSIMHVFNPRRLDAIEWALSIEKFCLEKYPNILSAAYCRTFNVCVHLLLDLPNEGFEHDAFFPEIWHEIKRTRVKTLFNYKSRNREKIAVLLSFCGEKVLKKVWNSKVAIRKD